MEIVANEKKFSLDDKKRISDKVQRIVSDFNSQNITKEEKKEKKRQIAYIFKIIHDNENTYTKNNQGIFFCMNALKNETINKIETFLNKIDGKKESVQNDNSNNDDSSYKSYSVDELNNLKLNNKEKNIIRRGRNILNTFNDSEDVIYKLYDTQTLSETSEQHPK